MRRQCLANTSPRGMKLIYIKGNDRNHGFPVPSIDNEGNDTRSPDRRFSIHDRFSGAQDYHCVARSEKEKLTSPFIRVMQMFRFRNGDVIAVLLIECIFTSLPMVFIRTIFLARRSTDSRFYIFGMTLGLDIFLGSMSSENSARLTSLRSVLSKITVVNRFLLHS